LYPEYLSYLIDNSIAHETSSGFHILQGRNLFGECRRVTFLCCDDERHVDALNVSKGGWHCCRQTTINGVVNPKRPKRWGEKNDKV
jgi:hypothetical protein